RAVVERAERRRLQHEEAARDVGRHHRGCREHVEFPLPLPRPPDVHADVGAGDQRAEPRYGAARDTRPNDPELRVLDEEFLGPGSELRGPDDALVIVREAQRRERADVEALVTDLGLPGLEALAGPEDDRDLRPL